jgi:hypothetical protein
MTVTTATTLDEPEHFSFPVLAKMVCFGLMGVGALTFGLSWIGGWDIAMSGWTIAAWYALGFPLFATIFICISHVSGSAWHATLKRVPEAMTGYFWVGLVTLLLLVLAALTGNFYEWADHEGHHGLHGELIEHKSPWLNPGFFIIRMAIYFAIWMACAAALVRLSRRQDIDGDVQHTRRGILIAAPFCFLFAITVSFASIDYVMSVEPTWFSTMFGVYQFGGIMESGFAMLALLLIFLRQTGYMRKAVNENHLHNVGIWLLSCATFWAYVWFCQFMLIWYSNIPEETAHFLARWNDPHWFWISFVFNPVLNWVIPFLLLLPRPNKRSNKMLAIAACSALLGRFVDQWQFVAPHPVLHDGVPVASAGLATFLLIGVTVGMIGLFVFFALKALEKAPLLAKKDPFFEEGLHHHL